MDVMKEYRARHSISQKEMAQRLGITQQAYSMIERDEQEACLTFIVKYREVTGINLVESPDMERVRAKVEELVRVVGELQKLLK